MYMIINKILIILAAFSTIVPYSKQVINLSLLNVLVSSSVLFFIVDYRKWKLISKYDFYILCAVLFANVIDLATSEYYIKRSLFWSLGLFVFFLLIFARPFTLQIFARWYVYFFCVSSITAVSQSFGYDWAWETRSLFGMPTDLTVLDQIESREKAPGLAYNAIQFSYQSLMAILFVYFFFFRERILAQMFFGVILLGLISTGSLSLLFLFSTFYIYAYWQFFRWYIVFFIMVILISASQISVLTRVIIFYEDSSFTSRLSLLEIAVAMIPNLPLLGYSLPEVERLRLFLAHEYGASDWVAYIPFHNSWLTILLENGWLMLVTYLYVFFIVLKISMRLYECNTMVNQTYCTEKLIHLNYRLLSFGVLAYILKTSLHNAGIQTGDVYGWMLIALISSMYKHHKNEFPLFHSNDKLNVK